MKNPVDVAIELVDRFNEQKIEDAKKCAMIVCDVIMDANINLDGEQPKRYMEMVHDFYYNVKREING